MKIPFLDLRITNENEKRELLNAIEIVFSHGRFIMGPEVQQFEEKIASLSERSFAVGVGSGTDALFLALKSLGIGVGDEVITTSLSWIATANAISLTGATPVFADIRDDLNIDPSSVEHLITSHTKAILPVHYTGKVCQIDKLLQIAHNHNLFIIEDASQAFGAKKNGHVAGSFGHIACFSMNPMKVLGACGEAGCIVLDEKKLYEKIIALRYNGTVNKETCIEPSLNGRIDTLQAAILLHRLTYVNEIINKRRTIASWYNKHLQGVLNIPIENDDEYDSYYSYTIRTSRRDELKLFLERRNIETKIQHPILMPHQPAYCNNVRGEFSRAEKIVSQILCLPAHEKMSCNDVEYVALAINDYFQGEK